MMLKLNLLDTKTNNKYTIEVYPMKRYDFKIILTNQEDKPLITLPEHIKKYQDDVIYNATIFKNDIIEIHWNGGFMKAFWTNIYDWLSLVDSDHLYEEDDFFYYEEGKDYIILRHFPPLDELSVIDYEIDEEEFRDVLGDDFYGNDILDQLKSSLPSKN